ncbi:MAG TPA: serine/threonine-protein kinase, partial [Blastocatellia bacterium]|nr:serine/threonine-protein kinase [Blastocatellia bacterium]
DQDSLRRFEREARASAKLSHPNIVAVFDYGRTSLAEGAFLVMELVPGGTLRSELVAAAALPSPVVADWFDQVLDGVNAAHGAGVIHRDLKPENILIIKSDHNRALIKVLDFGLAKLKLHDTAHSGSLTAPGVIMGTINYMSPEQLAGDEVDERSDIFALGVIIVEALTGSRPFAGATLLELQNAILRRSFNLEGTSPEVVRLDKVLQRCLAKDPRQRYSTVGEVQKDLIPAIRGLAESARLG